MNRLSLAARRHVYIYVSLSIYPYIYRYTCRYVIHMYIFVLAATPAYPTEPNRFSEDESNTPNQKGGGGSVCFFKAFLCFESHTVRDVVS